MKPSCHDCIHHRTIPGDAHIQCAHPKINPVETLLTPLLLMSGSQNSPDMKRLNVMGDRTGIRRGWFNWPLNFDPVWLLTCDGFEGKEVSNHETDAAK
jgi:hypothetical protein